MSSDDNCDFCLGKGKNFVNESCTYCNGTGEWNQAAQSYVKNHICQCIIWDRKFCPVCKKICHHDTTVSPKQVIDSGYGGLGNVKAEPKEKPKEEMEIVA